MTDSAETSFAVHNSYYEENCRRFADKNRFEERTQILNYIQSWLQIGHTMNLSSLSSIESRNVKVIRDECDGA